MNPRCPKCGYTAEDCRTHGDHHLCGEPDPLSANRRELQLGELLFSFRSMNDWVNNASRIWRKHQVDARNTICIDSVGRICGWGAHFMQARDEKAYPIDVYRIRS